MPEGNGVVDHNALERLIADVTGSGGAEIANAQPFIERLTAALGLPQPDFAKEENRFNDYVFERSVDFKHPDGSTTKGRIDCYKRDSFVLEAKQSAKRKGKAPDEAQIELLPDDATGRKLGHAKRGTRSWDKVMLAARKQAEDYARALPVDHGYPPFLLIVDVGHVVEVYADFSGQGKNYAHFPDRQGYRISMDDLRDPQIQDRLRSIWTDPLSLDPAKKSAEVTRDIAERLARIAKRLEGKHDPKDVAEFLMRCLFTMFAEDVELIPKSSFEDLLDRIRDKPETFVPQLETLWRTMDEGGFEPLSGADLRKFNGSLFKTRTALPLDADGISELRIAAGRDWRDVEPAIFGTLLERALDPVERSRLGAHYTPRAYVERLVVPTIIEPLRAVWDTVQARIQDLIENGEKRDALRAAQAFHRQLCTARVLDPACGTGNFLYVSLELMKKLEGEVLEVIADLGGQPSRYADHPEQARIGAVGQRLARTGGRFTVDPHQFYGLELNPRAVAIADLVLWIGYIKNQIKTSGLGAVQEPVLDAYGTIREQDAILAYDRQELLRDERGRPLSRWDGVTKKLHPITGEEIPDPDAKVPIYAYVNPSRAEWPDAEFIVGNPPFIGSKRMRSELGDGYAEACWLTRPHVPGGADFVMHFWDEAAQRLARKGTKAAPNPLRRFGFITTNSITQAFSRRVVEKALGAKQPISLVFAVADHPWLKATDKAAVRIAMTVAERGEHKGVLAKVKTEAGLDSDTPKVELAKEEGKLTAKLTLGAPVFQSKPLLANSLIAAFGMALHGQAFVVSSALKGKLEKTDRIKPYLKGGDLTDRVVHRHVIDLSGLSAQEVMERYPRIFAHLLTYLKPERDLNQRDTIRENWWLYGWDRPHLRSALAGISRFIGTTETSKHRLFQFISSHAIPDHMIVALAIELGEHLSLLSSRAHVGWVLASGGTLEDRPRYNKTRTFDPFPFPPCVMDDSSPDLRRRLGVLGDRLDVFRRERLAEHSFLTMTSLYNVLERLRELENGAEVPPLTDAERDIHAAGLVSVLKDIHDQIDRATFEAYGWDDLADRLVGKPGATMPSPHKSADQEEAEEELLKRLVALNVERQAEEKRGFVRWLRPDYQIPRLGDKVVRPDEMKQTDADLIVVPVAEQPKWPSDAFDQIRLVKDMLAKAPAPALPEEIASVFGGRNTQKRKDRVDEVLRLLAETGAARTGELDGKTRYFVPR